MQLPDSNYSSRKHKRMLAEINIVPFVDVVLVLLIVFMAVSPIILQNDIKVDLPKVRKQVATAKTPTNQWVITLNTRGNIFLSNNTRQGQRARTPITLDKLHKDIRTHLKTQPLEVYIRADKQVIYDRVMVLMDAVKKAGVAEVGLVTQAL